MINLFYYMSSWTFAALLAVLMYSFGWLPLPIGVALSLLIILLPVMVARKLSGLGPMLLLREVFRVPSVELSIGVYLMVLGRAYMISPPNGNLYVALIGTVYLLIGVASFTFGVGRAFFHNGNNVSAK